MRKWLAATFASPEQVTDNKICFFSTGKRRRKSPDGEKQRGAADPAICCSGNQDRDLHREDLPEDVQDTDDGNPRGGWSTLGGQLILIEAR